MLTDADGNWIYSIRVGGYGEGGPWDDALAALALGVPVLTDRSRSLDWK